MTATIETKLLVVVGEPRAKPVVGHGPFGMNNRAEIRKGFEDCQLGRMGGLARWQWRPSRTHVETDYEDGGLAMFTHPLDLEALLKEWP